MSQMAVDSIPFASTASGMHCCRAACINRSEHMFSPVCIVLFLRNRNAQWVADSEQ